MNTFRSNIISIYGEKGKAWLDELPQLVSAISSGLDLRDLKAVDVKIVVASFYFTQPLQLGLYALLLQAPSI